MGNRYDDALASDEADEPNRFDQALAQGVEPEPVFSSSADQESFFSRLTDALTESAQTNPLAAMAVGAGELAQRSGAEISEGLGKVADMPLDFTNPANVGGIAEGLAGILQSVYAPVTSLGHMAGEATLEVTGSPAVATAVDLTTQLATGLRYDRAIYKGVKAVEGLADKLDDVAFRYPKGAGPTPPVATEIGKAADPAIDDVLKSTPPSTAAVDPAQAEARGQAIAGRAQNLRERIYESLNETRERLTPRWFADLFHERYGLPVPYVAAKRAQIAKIAEAQEEAQAALTDLTKHVSFTTRRGITQWMTSGDLDLTELRRIPGMTDEMASRVVGIRTKIDRNSAEFLELSIPDETKDTIAANLGKYLPRVYRQYATPDFRPTEDVIEGARNYLLAEGTTKSGRPLGEDQVTNILDGIMQGRSFDAFTVGRVNPARLNAGLLKKRKDIPQPLLDLMGVFEEAGVPEAKALASQRAFIEKHKFFQGVAANRDWTLPDVLVTRLKTPPFGSSAFLGAKELVYNGVKYKLMPETTGLGALKGKYVQEFIADDLTQMQREFGVLEQWVPEFKLHKTVLSIKTHFRNVVGNGVLMNISGVPLPKIPLLLGRSIREMVTGEQLYQRMIRGEDISQLMNGVGGKYVAAKKTGLLGTTITANELNVIASAWEAAEKAGTKGPVLGQLYKFYQGLKRKSAGVYQAEEAVFKMAKVLDGMDKGATIEAAADEARKVLYDYSEVSKAVGALRRGVVFGSPFITFTAKTLPRLGEAAIKHPVAFWKYPVIFAEASAIAAEMAGFTDTQYTQLLKQMPDYIRKGAFLLMPFKDRKGNPQFVDFTYLMPWGQITEMVSNVGNIAKDPGGVLKQFLGPGGNLAVALAAPIINNQDAKDPFSGRIIFRRGDRPLVKVQKALSYMYRALLSPLVPGIPGIFEGGYDFQRVTDAVRGVSQTPNKEPMSVPAAIAASTVGMKTTPVDPAQVRRSLAIQFKLESEAIREVIYDARRRGDTVTVKEETARLRDLAKDFRARTSSVKQDETNQFKTFYRDFMRSYGLGTGP